MSTQRITIRSVEELVRLVDILHDRDYDLENLTYNAATGHVTISTSVVDEEPCDDKSSFFWKRKYSVRKAVLDISNVLEFVVADRAEIGIGDFNTISVEGDAIVIKGSLPVTLTAKVSSLLVTLEITDQELRKVSGFRRDFLRS